MLRVWSVAGVVSALSLISGCGQPSPPSPAATGTPTEVAKPPLTPSVEVPESPATSETAETAVADGATAPAIPTWRTSVELVMGTWADTEKLIAEHQGKVVVLDVWSTACEPCLREFPHLVELQKKHPDEIVCVAINSDYAGVRKKPPEFYRERVQKVLEEKQAKVLNVLCTEPADELFTELKIDSIPAVFVYGRDGEVAAKFDHRTTDMGEFTYAEHVVPVVQKLLSPVEETAEAAPSLAP